MKKTTIIKTPAPRPIHAAHGTDPLPYDQLYHFPPHLLFLLTEKISD
jgi:hypothetical protein